MAQAHGTPPARAGKNLFFILAACAACLQWILLRGAVASLPIPWNALLPGLSIIGAGFLMTWAAEAAEVDLPQNVSIAIIALIAVLPEYAVDIYFAWTAGKNPAYAAYAAANMTGANRLLIGVGWPAVLLTCWCKRGIRRVRLGESQAIELTTLLVATIYAFLLPLKKTLSLWDTVFFLGLFCVYGFFSSRTEVEEPELEDGPAQMIAKLPETRRRAAVTLIFIFSALAIGLSAQPFAEGLLDAGRRLGIEEFLLIQWLAPLASEAPEFIVAILLALRGKPQVGLRALVSSKVNQWTLLVGMLPAAFAGSSHSLSPLPLDPRQNGEIFLTAAQSLFGLVLLMNLSFSFWEAAALLGLFAAQIAFPQPATRYFFGAAYLLGVAGILLFQKDRCGQIRARLAYILKLLN